MIARLVLGVVLALGAVALVRWLIVAGVQRRLRRLGRTLEHRGYRFEDWLREAGLDEAALADRRRRMRTSLALIEAGERLLARER